MTDAIPVAAPYNPSALVRGSPAGNVVTSNDSAPGVAIAAPMPSRPRNRIRAVPLGESPPSSEAMPNRARPKRNTFLRPSTSPTRPATNISPPNVNEYELITQARFDAVMCSERSMLGMATIMMVPSSTTMNRARAMTNVAIPSLRSGSGGAAAVPTPTSCVAIVGLLQGTRSDIHPVFSGAQRSNSS